MSEQMTKKQRLYHLQGLLGYLEGHLGSEAKETLRLSIADLRNEQPCGCCGEGFKDFTGRGVSDELQIYNRPTTL